MRDVLQWWINYVHRPSGLIDHPVLVSEFLSNAYPSATLDFPTPDVQANGGRKTNLRSEEIAQGELVPVSAYDV